LWHILNSSEEFKIIAPFKQTFDIIHVPALASSGWEETTQWLGSQGPGNPIRYGMVEVSPYIEEIS
jgi:hypothetical protein